MDKYEGIIFSFFQIMGRNNPLLGEPDFLRFIYLEPTFSIEVDFYRLVGDRIKWDYCNFFRWIEKLEGENKGVLFSFIVVSEDFSEEQIWLWSE